MNNRNSYIDQLILSAVKDFTRITQLSLLTVEGDYVIFVDDRKTVTISRFYEEDKFYVRIICHLKADIDTSRAYTLTQIIESKEVKEFLEYYSLELVLDEGKELLQISMWDFQYADYAILKSFIIFLLTEAFHNMSKTLDLLEEKEKEYEKIMLN